MRGQTGYSPAVKTAEQIVKIEKACRIVAETLKLMEKSVRPGIETIELDRIAEDYIRSQGAEPAFKGYKVDNRYFPYTLCVSIDDEVVHGMPGGRKLIEGEIVSIDCGCKLDGYYGDSAITVGVGEVDAEKQKLMKITEESLLLGIEQALHGNKLYDISKAIQHHCESNGFSLTRELTGHGIGANLHEEPAIPNFVPPLLHRSRMPNVGLLTGNALAIEPMVHAGTYQVVTTKDGWTVKTKDGRPSAHFEHTVIVQDKKALILTLR
jgi:methionyl aminopeptidase